MEKKQSIKSLLQEPPISKDCLRNSHFHQNNLNSYIRLLFLLVFHKIIEENWTNFESK